MIELLITAGAIMISKLSEPTYVSTKTDSIQYGGGGSDDTSFAFNDDPSMLLLKSIYTQLQDVQHKLTKT